MQLADTYQPMEAMKSSIKNISIIGAGAMGAVYARMLYDMDPGSISFVARGDTQSINFLS
jgi:hypothetical protein